MKKIDPSPPTDFLHMSIEVRALLATTALPCDYDAVIVSDGSGSTWERAIGWAAVVLTKSCDSGKVLTGAMSAGTCYLAELMPYVHGLSWFVENDGRDILNAKLRLRAGSMVDIIAITDNEAIAKQGQGIYPRKVGDYYWAMFEAVERRGFRLHWHWIPRESIGFNRLADHLAGESRKSLLSYPSISASLPKKDDP